MGGGGLNTAGSSDADPTNATYATVSGGRSNGARGAYSTIGGGNNNAATESSATVGGGVHNWATDVSTTIGGGSYNEASGQFSTISGGRLNATAPGADYSFAAGRQAKANNQGCFVWGDSTPDDVTCSNDNRWVSRASGGVYFYSSSDLSTGSYLAAGSGTWANVSDRDAKENFAPVSTREVLQRVVAIPVSTWNYRTEDPSIRHMGPMAQDLHAAFALGDSEESITTIDADGVALASIQGLYDIVKEKDSRITELEERNADIEARIAALEALIVKQLGKTEGGAR